MAGCYVGIVLAAGASLVGAAGVTPPQLVFEKEHTVRNFFNTSIPLDRLDLSGAQAIATTNHTDVGCALSRGGGTLRFANPSMAVQESLVRVGALYPYSAIDLDISAQAHTAYSANAILALYKDRGNWVAIALRSAKAANPSITMEVFKDGKSVKSVMLAAQAVEAPCTLRAHLGGKYVSVFVVKGAKWQYLKTVDIGHEFDLRRKTLCSDFSVCVGARLAHGESIAFTRAEQYLTCGTGQADPSVVKNERGEPLVDGDSIWVAMTTRGYDPIPASHQGVYRFDMVTHAWTLVGDMVFDKGDGVLRGWHATDILFDRRDHQWKVFTVSHGDDHRIYHGVCEKDPREGVTAVSVGPCDYDSGGNEEDPSVIYDESARMWRMAMCKAGRGGYRTVLFEADRWDGKWTEIARNEATSSTGTLIQKIDGKYYVFTGRGNANYEVLAYPDLVKLGSLDVKDIVTSRNVWPAIVPIARDGGASIYMLTFDRSTTTGRYSYGDLYWYRATPKP